MQLPYKESNFESIEQYETLTLLWQPIAFDGLAAKVEV
jgi:hypothetical protein